MRVTAALAALGALELVLGRGGLAAPARERAGDDATAGGEVSSLISDAVAEYGAGHFEEARALFRRAHRESPSARTLRGIGMASFELRDYVDATRSLSAALREERDPLPVDQRRHVEGLLARAESYVARFALRLQPAEATLTVDGSVAERESDGTLLLPFGHHRMVASCPSCTIVDREIDVLGGERQDLAFTLAAVTAAPQKPAADPNALVAASLRADAAATDHHAAARWFAGVALLSAGGAVASAFWWRERAATLDTCHMAGDRCKNEPTVATERGLAVGATAGLGVAAAATGVAAALLWGRRDRGGAPALACLGGRRSVSCAVGF